MDVVPTSLPPNSMSQCFGKIHSLDTSVTLSYAIAVLLCSLLVVRTGIYKDLRHFSTSYLWPRHRFKNVETRCSADAYARLRTATVVSPKCISCISKMRAFSLCLCCSRKLEFNRSYLFDNIGHVKKYPRHIVRSEVAEAGMSDTGHPFSAAFKVLGQVRGILFYTVTAVAAIFLFQLMLLAHPFVLLFDRYRRKAHHMIAKIWATLAVALFYRIQIQGLENLPPPDTPAVYVSNHQSFLDIFTLLTLGRSFKFISKTEIFVIPIIGWAMYIMGTIPLRRMDARSQIDTFKRCMDLIKKGASVFFFPEGTRSKDGKLGDFKKGAFSIAAKTRVPVVPITLIGTGQIMPSGQESIVNPGSVKMIIHRPIEGTSADALCKDARSIISRELSNQGL